MEAAGVLIYGYNRADAVRIKAFLDAAFSFPVFMTSASGRKGEKIIEILESTAADLFADEKTKIMMLLGFAEQQINTVLGSFPTGEGDLQRPIFCMMTEQNRNWPLQQLLEHLEEERRYWAENKHD